MSTLFNRLVNISGRRPSGARVSVSLKSCVMDGSFDEPLSDEATGTNRQKVTFVVKRIDWTEVAPPQVGDIVVDECGKRFAVTRVEPFYDREWVIDARSTK